MPTTRPAGRRAAAAILTAAAAAAALAAGTATAGAAVITSGGTSLTSGGGDSCVIRTGHAWCWGANEYGQLGNGTTTGVTGGVPVMTEAVTSGVLAGVKLTHLSASPNGTCALDTAGAAYCWGYGGDGQLGDGSTVSSDVPVAVSGGHRFTEISAGVGHTCAVDTAGHAWCWGAVNSSGTPASTVPAEVPGGHTWRQVDAAGLAACGIDTAWHAWCWGWGPGGQLGDGSLTSAATPVRVSTSGALARVQLKAVAGNAGTICALSRADRAYCWGAGGGGQLGDGTAPGVSDVPVAVAGGHAFTSVAPGLDVVCGLSGGKPWCWGDGNSGDLGDGTISGSSIPVPVGTSGALAGLRLTQISAGEATGCTINQGVSAYCWGSNALDALGTGQDSTALPYSDVPVQVAAHT